MSEKVTTGLDNPVFAGRLRSHRPHAPQARVVRRPYVETRSPLPQRQSVVAAASTPVVKPTPASAPIQQGTLPVEYITRTKPVEQPKVAHVQPQAAAMQPPAPQPPAPALQPQVSRPPVPQFQATQPKQPEVQQQAKKRSLRASVGKLSGLRSLLSRPKADAQNGPPQGVWVRRGLVGMAAVIFLVGLAVAIQGFSVNRKLGTAQVSAQAAHGSEQQEEKPDEVEPSSHDVNSYTTAPDLPRYLEIPKLNVRSRVRAIGVDKKNQLQAPSNIFDVGWYKDTPKPGSVGGASLIDGHYSGLTRRGVMDRLKDLTKGDQVVVVRGDGKRITYKVVATELFDADKMDMAKALISKNSAKHGLNLITCAGTPKPGTNEYNKRLLVYTEVQ